MTKNQLKLYLKYLEEALGNIKRKVKFHLIKASNSKGYIKTKSKKYAMV